MDVAAVCLRGVGGAKRRPRRAAGRGRRACERARGSTGLGRAPSPRRDRCRGRTATLPSRTVHRLFQPAHLYAQCRRAARLGAFWRAHGAGESCRSLTSSIAPLPASASISTMACAVPRGSVSRAGRGCARTPHGALSEQRRDLRRRHDHQLHQRLQRALHLLRVLPARASHRGLHDVPRQGARARALCHRSGCDADHDPRRRQPELRLPWFEELFRRVAREHPNVDIHSLSVSEIAGLSQVEELPTREILVRLKAPG